MGVSSTEKTNTNKDLARAMAKTWSEMQTVTNRHVGQIIWELSYSQIFKGWRLQEVGKIRCRDPKNTFRRGQRLMIIRLGKYNEASKLLIGKGTTGSLGQICYQDIGLESMKDYGSCLHEGIGTEL